VENRLSEILDEALTHVADAKGGLPSDIFYFISQLTPMINVDLLIKNDRGQTLLTWRADRFYGPAWHIPGGIIRFKEKIEDRIEKVAQTELGCGVRFLPEPAKVSCLINKERDIRGHFISLLYLCELIGTPDPEKECRTDAPKQGQWYWHNRAPANLLRQHEAFRDFIDAPRPL